MHEMGLCEAVLAVVRDVSDDEPVRRVRVRAGRRQGVVPHVFDFCWRLVAQDTGAARAVLELTDVPVRVRCRTCGDEGEPRAGTIACPACGAVSVDVVAGDELVVEEVELEDGEVRRNPTLTIAPAGGS
jgi:hydrogenase nickel incorporation protein HypA/HybF